MMDETLLVLGGTCCVGERDADAGRRARSVHGTKHPSGLRKGFSEVVKPERAVQDPGAFAGIRSDIPQVPHQAQGPSGRSSDG